MEVEIFYHRHKLPVERSARVLCMRNTAKANAKRFRPWYEIARSELRARDITYARLGELMNVSTAAVGHWMTGRREPTLAQIKYIADLVGKSLSELCGEDPYFLTDLNERKLIDLFRTMSPSEREVFLRFFISNSNSPQK